MHVLHLHFDNTGTCTKHRLNHLLPGMLQDLINSMATVLMHFDGDMSSAVGRRMVRLPLQYAHF